MDIVGRYVICNTCGRRKAPVGRSTPLVTTWCEPKYEDTGCPGYYEHPEPGWLFRGERWSESFGWLPMPKPSECYAAIPEQETE